MKKRPLPNARVPGRGCRAALAAAALALMAAAPAGVAVEGAWMRSIIPSRPAAGYFTLENTSGADLSLVGASSPACGMLMLHQSMDMGGQAMMKMVPAVKLPAHGKVSFSPGGYHLMCVNPTSAMRHGATVPVTLRFSNGETITTPFPVRNALGK